MAVPDSLIRHMSNRDTSEPKILGAYFLILGDIDFVFGKYSLSCAMG